jgi:flagellar motor switch protein FliM
VAISVEVRIGETAGMMNLGIPSIMIKMLRQKFDQHWSVRKTQATQDEHARVLRLIRPANVHLDARLRGPMVSASMLLDLAAGDVLAFDYPVSKLLDVLVNGKLKYRGEVITTGRKRAFEVQQLVTEP